MNKLLNTMILTTMILTVVACKSEKSTVIVDGANKDDSALGGDSDNLVTTSSFSYNFTYNGCETKKQIFTSKNEMCLGLQDDSRNNGCAKKLRENYFNQMCSGTYTPFSTSLSDEPDYAPEVKIMETPNLSRNQKFNDTLELLVDNKQVVARSTFRCATIADLKTWNIEGLTMLGDSKVLYIKDSKHSNEAFKAAVAAECFTGENIEESDLIDADLAIHKVEVSDSREEQLYMGNDDGAKLETLNIKCVEDSNELLINVKGIVITKGSKIFFKEGYLNSNMRKSTVISCEEKLI